MGAGNGAGNRGKNTTCLTRNYGSSASNCPRRASRAIASNTRTVPDATLSCFGYRARRTSTSASTSAASDWSLGEDPATIVIRNRTLGEVKALMFKYEGNVQSAAKQGPIARQNAESADSTLRALAKQMTDDLND
jgi:hypothetical protein